MIAMVVHSDRKSHANRTWIFGKVLDPHSVAIRRANRWFLFSCVVGVAVDPLFLSLLSINSQLSCLYIQVVYAIVVTTLRCLVDAMYLWQIWLQLKLAYVSKKSLVLGRGDLVWDARKIAHHYLWPLQGFAFDVFVILPIPQVHNLKALQLLLFLPFLQSSYWKCRKIQQMCCLHRGYMQARMD
jgi:cyclic nucleotide gated channel